MNKKLNGLFILLLVVGFAGCTPETTETLTTAGGSAEVVDPSIDASGKSQYRILAWNVELDGGADVHVISKQLKEFEDYDLIALMETTPEAFSVIKKSTKFKGAIAQSGRQIRLALLWNDEKFSIEEFEELDNLNDKKMNHRSPWVMKVKETATGEAFYMITVHLARNRAELRQRQAEGIRDWARSQSLPIVAIGDFNFDYVFADEKGNKAFELFQEDDVMQWVRPEKWIDTNWYDPESDGADDYPGSMLDFAFVAGSAKDWSPRCRVIVREGDFPDDKQTSDHRPIELLLTPKY